ncbi:hypothetical protein OS11_32500 [Dickeya oryzae]
MQILRILADEKSSNSSNNKYSYKSKTVLGAPLKESESPMRVNLLGKERVLPKPKIVAAEPWAMGYNPKSK